MLGCLVRKYEREDWGEIKMRETEKEREREGELQGRTKRKK